MRTFRENSDNILFIALIIILYLYEVKITLQPWFHSTTDIKSIKFIEKTLDYVERTITRLM